MDADKFAAVWDKIIAEIRPPLPVGPAYPDFQERLDAGAAQCPRTEAA